MPFKADFGEGKEIEWTYDGNGLKLQKIVRKGGNVVSLQDYIGNIEYRNDTLEAIYHSEGRVFFEGGMPQYEYRIADHLDNTRVLFSDKNGDGIISENEISDVSSYYAFGLRHRGINSKINNTHDYLFNNKERVGDFGLRWDFYDFRVLDSEIGRFIQVDPIAEQFPHVSPMNYAENSPIANIDLHGLQKSGINKEAEFHRQVDQAVVQPIRDAVNKTIETISSIPGKIKSLMSNETPFNSTGEVAGSGIEIFSNTKLPGNGTANTPEAADGSTVILEENEINQMIPADAGGVMLKQATQSQEAADMINLAIGLTKIKDLSDIAEIRGGNSKPQDTLIVCPYCKDTVNINDQENYHTGKNNFKFDTITRDKRNDK